MFMLRDWTALELTLQGASLNQISPDPYYGLGEGNQVDPVPPSKVLVDSDLVSILLRLQFNLGVGNTED